MLIGPSAETNTSNQKDGTPAIEHSIDLENKEEHLATFIAACEKAKAPNQALMRAYASVAVYAYENGGDVVWG